MPLTRRAVLPLMGASAAGALTGCAGTIAGSPVAVGKPADPGPTGRAAPPAEPTGQPPIVDGDPAPGGSGPQATTIYCVAGRELQAVDAADGAVLWSANLTEYSSMDGPASVSPNAVYCLDDGGYVSAWSRDGGRQLARIGVGTDGLSVTAPLVLDGKVFIDNWTGDVVVLDADTLEVDSWTYHSGSTDAITASPVGSGDTVYFSSPAGEVIASPLLTAHSSGTPRSLGQPS